MGRMIYASSFTVDFDDRLLAHLQIVIGMKLRRGESFMFSWKDDQDVGDGRTTVWIDRAVPLVFRFSGGRPPSVNRAWIEALGTAAGSPSGLRIVAEPEEQS